MKIRTCYVSNSSSSSFTCYVNKNYIEDFKRDFEAFQDFILKMFPQYDERFYYEIHQRTTREEVIDYLNQHEKIKNPSEDMIEFFTEKLKKMNYFDDNIEITGVIDTEDNDIGFQNVCYEFIDNYNRLKKE